MTPLLLFSLLEFFTLSRSQPDLSLIPPKFIPEYTEEIPPLVYMQISEDCYEEACSICDSTYLNYEFKTVFETNDPSTGFHGRTYLVTNTNTNYSQVVIAFRGTDDLNDVVSDILMVGGIKTKQFESAQSYFEEAYSRFSNTHEITLTGHSLGGCLAYIEARRSNNTAFVFDTPGCENLVPESTPMESCSLITRFVKFPNLINIFGASKSCGEMYRIAPCDETEVYDLTSYWKDSHEVFHVGLVLATGFNLNPFWVIFNYLAYYLVRKELQSIFKGHNLLSFTEAFSNETGYPLHYQKIDPETWIPLMKGYTCTFNVENFKDGCLHLSEQNLLDAIMPPTLTVEEMSFIKKCWAGFKEFFLAAVIVCVNLYMRKNPKWKWELVNEVKKGIEKLKQSREKAFLNVIKRSEEVSEETSAM